MGERDALTGPPHTVRGNLKLPAIGLFFQADQYQIASVHACGLFLLGRDEIKHGLWRNDGLSGRPQELNILFPRLYPES